MCGELNVPGHIDPAEVAHVPGPGRHLGPHFGAIRPRAAAGTALAGGAIFMCRERGVLVALGEQVSKERPVRGDRRGEEAGHELGDGDEGRGYVVPGRIGG